MNWKDIKFKIGGKTLSIPPITHIGYENRNKAYQPEPIGEFTFTINSDEVKAISDAMPKDILKPFSNVVEYYMHRKNIYYFRGDYNFKLELADKLPYRYGDKLHVNFTTDII